MNAKENRPCRSYEDTLNFFMVVEKLGTVALVVRKAVVGLPVIPRSKLPGITKTLSKAVWASSYLVVRASKRLWQHWASPS